MKDIFDQTDLHGLRLQNRVFRSATWMALADDKGYVTDRIVELYKRLAKGGIGAIITGITSVVPTDKPLDGIMVFSDGSYAEGHKRITNAVHAAGSKIFLQAAMVASVKEGEDGCLHEVPIDGWTEDEIQKLVEQFGDSALRARTAGYDGVQIHAAHFFFLSQFISPLLNHRTDEYGGSSSKRARILVDILKDMRRKAGDDFCIIVKVNASDGVANGLSERDFIDICKNLADAGIDAIEVSANGTSRPHVRVGIDEAYFRDYAILLKKTCDVPVILVGGHRSMEAMNRLLSETPIDFLSMSRPFIREPGLLRRWRRGDTRPSLCISCNSCYGTPGHECVFNLRFGMNIR